MIKFQIFIMLHLYLMQHLQYNEIIYSYDCSSNLCRLFIRFVHITCCCLQTVLKLKMCACYHHGSLSICLFYTFLQCCITAALFTRTQTKTFRTTEGISSIQSWVVSQILMLPQQSESLHSLWLHLDLLHAHSHYVEEQMPPFLHYFNIYVLQN